ncbi:T6SS protein Cts1F [Enterobacter cloacae subsp. cloacae]|uniref:TagK domain-containing protein n=1 Tax=Enterobacter cloacae TaxID=550 RepID=UPI00063AA39E|nr:TagK domain-containing protein [Enterobacter cloacae]KLG05273.1 T6SS protein Cts1F [Enterobacter cloacae subsp. cloacae]
MKFRFIWPASHQVVTLPEEITAEQAIALDVSSGGFGPYNQVPEGHDAVAFYWHFTRPVIWNLCGNYICLLDGVELQYGESQPLRVGSHLQVGNFKLDIISGDANAQNEQDFCPLIYPDNAWQSANNLPEVEDILPNGGSYMNDLHCFNDVIVQGGSKDVLKTLETEYRRFLILREHSGQYYGNVGNQDAYIIKTDNNFDSLKEGVKKKTLTECIVDRTYLMEKVWPDFETGEALDDIFAEEEKIDLLKSLSPAHIVAKGKYRVPELVFRDFHKIGLDSHY